MSAIFEGRGDDGHYLFQTDALKYASAFYNWRADDEFREFAVESTAGNV